MAFLSIRLHVLKDGKEIFFHRQFSKDGRFLRQISNPPRAPVYTWAGASPQAHPNGPCPDLDVPDRRSYKGCCLAGAIFTEQANNAPWATSRLTWSTTMRPPYSFTRSFARIFTGSFSFKQAPYQQNRWLQAHRASCKIYRPNRAHLRALQSGRSGLPHGEPLPSCAE